MFKSLILYDQLYLKPISRDHLFKPSTSRILQECSSEFSNNFDRNFSRLTIGILERLWNSLESLQENTIYAMH
jgi:hypothetical protein